MFRVAAILKRLSDEHNCPVSLSRINRSAYHSRLRMQVLAINQVTDFFDSTKNAYMKAWSVETSGRRVIPSLGALSLSPLSRSPL